MSADRASSPVVSERRVRNADRLILAMRIFRQRICAHTYIHVQQRTRVDEHCASPLNHFFLEREKLSCT